MTARLKQLAAWPLSPRLFGLADGELPHPIFEAKCQPIRFEERRARFGLRLERVQAVGPSGRSPAAAMWENDFGDGHSFEVMFCEIKNGSVEFWNVWYADDMDGPSPELVGRSEQGLYYWLFFYLISAQFFRSRTNAHAFDALRAAANAVRFRHLDDVLAFEEEFGTDEQSRALIREKSVQIRD